MLSIVAVRYGPEALRNLQLRWGFTFPLSLLLQLLVQITYEKEKVSFTKRKKVKQRESTHDEFEGCSSAKSPCNCKIS